MTQEDRELLVKDLCARLPYGVKVELIKYKQKCLLCGIDGEDLYLNIDSDPFSLRDFDIKPYLRPMSSMTEEEEQYVLNTWSEDDLNNGIDLMYDNYMMLGYASDFIDWLNEHHFDYRGLIDKSLAIVAPEDMYNYENN